MKFRYIFVTLLLLLSNQIFAQPKYSKVRIYTDIKGLEKLQEIGVDLENIGGKPGVYTDIELSENEIKQIPENGYNYDILIEDVSKFYQQRYKTSSAETLNPLKGTKYVTPANFNLGSMGGFLTLDEVNAELDEMRVLYPDLISEKFIIGNIQTLEGRDMYAVKISDNPDVNESEAEVLYTALIHAREPQSMQQLIWFMWYLLENYGTDDEITGLVNNLQLYFIPVVNPDGYEYNHQTNPNGGGMWRKNKRDNDNNGSFSEYSDGVDLNRNFGYQWAYDDNGSSPDPESQTYRGVSAFSEPVTQNLRDFVNEHNFLLAHNHHTYSNLILFPWGYENIHTPDDPVIRSYAELMASENGYETGQSGEILYTVNGDANDWMYGEQSSKPKIFAYTQETGSSSDGFWPSQNRIVPLCEESYLSNLYLARFATPYVKLTDGSSEFISQNGYLKFNLKRMGLSGNGSYTLTITPDNTVFSSLGGTKNIILSEVLSQTTDSLAYTLSNDIEYGDSFSYTVTISSGSYFLSKTFTKSYYDTEVIISDTGNDLSNWTTSGWNITNEDSYSPDYSITDSPGSEYGNDENNAITLNSEIDLTNTDNPQLKFWAKWNIENNWDYVQLLISEDNGTSWIPLQTEHTNAGEGSFQPAGEPLYDGSSDWVEETIDLSNYVGKSIKFRFELHSDGSLTYDGFYFDDFKIISTITSLNSSIVSEAGCGENSGKIIVHSTRSGNQTFYLRDDAGNPVNEWTGDATYYIFENLSDGIYRGQVEKDAELSPLSDPVELIHVSDLPVASESVQATENEICSGSSTVLSYTGGSGSVFSWYSGSCGDIHVFDGNNIPIIINEETTFFGRWENVCGVSDCKQIMISVLPETNITSHPQNITANIGDNISFSVSAEGDNLIYQWRKNTSDVNGAADAVLSFDNVLVTDAGNYDVVVSGTCGQIISNTAVLDINSSVNKPEKSDIKIYPNPSKGSFKLSANRNIRDYNVKITDITGKLIYLDSNVKRSETDINLTNASKGIYFLEIKTKNDSYLKKIIIE